MAISKVILNNVTQMDVTGTTATPADVAQGKYFTQANGVETQGTASGGGGGAVEEKDVNFIDYDGTLLYSYSAADFANLGSLPANPSHTGLTAQGWNWTKAQITAQLAAMPNDPVWVGQMYITESRDTEIDIALPEGRTSPYLSYAVNGSITIDWGDNSTPTTDTGTSLTTRKGTQHVYASAGEYTIKIHVASGSFTFYGTSTYLLLYKSSSANTNRVYANCVLAIRLGSNVTSIGNNAFYYCTSLKYITMPSGVTSIGSYAFYLCYSIKSITIPSGVSAISGYIAYYCYSLTSVSMPSNLTSIDIYAFQHCHSLQTVTIPSGVVSIGSYAFNNCSALRSITIPSGVTSIGDSCFAANIALVEIRLLNGLESIGSGVFTGCSALASITVPATVTSIGNTVFSNCYGMAEYHFLSTTPPTAGTSPFASIQQDCVIYVPSASLSDYQAATNWSTYASYMQGE